MKKSLLSMAALAFTLSAFAGVGTAEDPMTVADVIAAGSEGSYPDTYVTGYIVGYLPSGAGVSIANAVFSASGAPETNLLLADASAEDEPTMCIPVQLPSGSNIRTALNLALHPNNLGHKVTICGTREKYFGSPALKSASSYTWIGDAPVDDVAQPLGTKEAPITVPELIAAPSNGAATWVKGYVVGSIPGMNFSETVFGLGDNASSTNIVIAETAEVKDYTLCVPVAIPAGALRDVITLANNPELLGKEIVLYGSHEKYFGAPGLKNVTEYILDGQGGGGDISDGSVWKSLNQTDAECDWTFENVEMDESLSYVWSWKEYNGNHYLNGSSFVGSAKAAKAYAVSPVVTLPEGGETTVVFEHAAKFQTNLRQDDKFLIREEGATEWTELAIPTWPEAGNWNFVESGAIDITAYAGKKIQFGFLYVGTATQADTWGIRNLVVSSTAAVDGIAAEAGEAIWFDLQGKRVANPEKGLYIKVVGNKASKVIVK